MEQMTKEEIIAIMEGEYGEIDSPDKILEGIQLLSKYASGRVIEGAGHDEIWLIDISEAIENGITEQVCIELNQLGFCLDDENEYFIRYV